MDVPILSHLQIASHAALLYDCAEVTDMGSMQPKKMLILNILEILKKHSNENHPLTQKQIGDLLEKNYGMIVDRKAIKRNLANLMESDYPVRTKSEQIRTGISKETGEKEENVACSDFYYEHAFSEGELRLLINGVLFSKGVSHRQGKDLIHKIESLTDDSFQYRTGHIHALPDNQPENRQLFYVLEVLDDAIGKKKKVEFSYNSYGTDKKLHPRLDEAGLEKKQIIIVVASVLAVLALIIGIIIGVRSCGKGSELVTPTSSSSESTAAPVPSTEPGGETSESTEESFDLGEEIILPEVDVGGGNGGSGNGNSGSGSGNGNSGSGNSGSGTSATATTSTENTTTSSEDTSVTTTNDGVIELPFVPADEL